MKNTGRKAVKGSTTSAPMVMKATAAKSSAGVGVPAAVAKTKPTRDEIAQRSYEIFLARGGTNGRDVEDWIQAERDLGA